jgi:hypothetical protein
METIQKNQHDDSRRASRAIGAMFFSIFGGAWIAYWSVLTFSGSLLAPALIALLTVAVFMLSLNQYRRYRSALQAEADSPARRRTGRLFNIINVAQWVVIVIGANILTNTGFGRWIVPFMIFVIGLHFLPLAYIFSNPPHYITGGAMIVVALTYPLLFSGGPSNPIGCLGAGLILWASAMWAVREHSDSQTVEA